MLDPVQDSYAHDRQPIVLIVDDQPNNLQLLSTTLAEADLQVAVAVDGEGALEQLRYVKPDLILLDIVMPGIDGIETCRRLREDPNTADIPIIFMTAIDDLEQKSRGFAMGAVDYITKPFQQVEVLARVQVHLDLSRMAKRLAEQNEQLRLQAELLNRANHVKTEFLTRINQELRTPLNSILGYTQGLQRSADLGGRETRWVEGIQGAGLHLLSLVNDVLDASQIETRQLKLESDWLELETFLQQIVRLFSVRAEQQRFAFTTEIDSQLPERIFADEKRLRQVFLNLLGNAFQYTEEGSVVLQVGAEQRRERLHLLVTVQDTGIGISPEQQLRIFEPFEQLHSHHHYARGAGLGLSICQGLVHLMGGDMILRSKPKSGSSFSLEIPIQTEQTKALGGSNPGLPTNILSGERAAPPSLPAAPEDIQGNVEPQT